MKDFYYTASVPNFTSMGLFRFLIICGIIYLLYKLIFKFIIPVAKTSAEFQAKVREMRNEQMRQNGSQEPPPPPPQTNAPGHRGKQGSEYIEFEEVK